MRADGIILGYLKMPLKTGAENRLRHEAETVEKLYRFAKLRAHIPRLLFAGSWAGRYVVFQSAIEGEAGPVHITERHEEFLKILHSCEPSMTPGRKLVQRTAQQWEKVAPRLETHWQRLGREALRIASRELDSYQLLRGAARRFCSVEHAGSAERIDPVRLGIGGIRSAGVVGPVPFFGADRVPLERRADERRMCGVGTAQFTCFIC